LEFHQDLLIIKLDSLDYHATLFAWWYVWPIWCDYDLWQTDRQTDTEPQRYHASTASHSKGVEF